MTERKFRYQKRDGAIGHYRVFVLEETDLYLVGLKNEDLSEADEKFLRERNEPLSREEAARFMGRFRKFSKNNILEG